MRKVIRTCCLLLSILMAAVPLEAQRTCLVASVRSAVGQEWPEKLAQPEKRVTEAKSSSDCESAKSTKPRGLDVTQHGEEAYNLET
jgi:hypothetical protein